MLCLWLGQQFIRIAVVTSARGWYSTCVRTLCRFSHPRPIDPIFVAGVRWVTKWNSSNKRGQSVDRRWSFQKRRNCRASSVVKLVEEAHHVLNEWYKYEWPPHHIKLLDTWRPIKNSDENASTIHIVYETRTLINHYNDLINLLCRKWQRIACDCGNSFRWPSNLRFYKEKWMFLGKLMKLWKTYSEYKLLSLKDVIDYIEVTILSLATTILGYTKQKQLIYILQSFNFNGFISKKSPRPIFDRNY